MSAPSAEVECVQLRPLRQNVNGSGGSHNNSSASTLSLDDGSEAEEDEEDEEALRRRRRRRAPGWLVGWLSASRSIDARQTIPRTIGILLFSLAALASLVAILTDGRSHEPEHGGSEVVRVNDPTDGSLLRVLFVGNSFTYGPPDATDPDPRASYSLPGMFALVARSRGVDVEVAEDTLGGCTLFAAHRPSSMCNASDPDEDAKGAEGAEGGTPRGPVRPPPLRLLDPSTTTCAPPEPPAGGAPFRVPKGSAPCPQAAAVAREMTGTRDDDARAVSTTETKRSARRWDVVVLQDHSAVPSVPGAARAYTVPAVKEFVSLTRTPGSALRGAVVALYITHAYLNGAVGDDGRRSGCPPRHRRFEACFPLGDVDAMTSPPCDDGGGDAGAFGDNATTDWAASTSTFACQGYALAKGYAAVRAATGADVLVPAGLAWQAARGWPSIHPRCREAVDAGFERFPPPDVDPDRRRTPPPPLPPIPMTGRARPDEARTARWAGGEAAAVPLYRDKGPGYASKYCSSPLLDRPAEGSGRNEAVPCHVDHHASALGMYLTATTFFATLTGMSPVGAAVPAGELVRFAAGRRSRGVTSIAGGFSREDDKEVRMPTIDPVDAAAAQRVAEDVVAPYLSSWNPRLVSQS